MNFQDLKKIEAADFYLDVAFRRATAAANELRQRAKGSDRLAKSKKLETAKLEVIRSVLSEHLQAILTSFPSIDRLDPFYNELIKLTLDYSDLKKSLGAVKWAVDKVSELSKSYMHKINRTNDFGVMNRLRREYYGRVSSVLKQIKTNLNYLEEARKTMKGYPAVKTSMFTVCLFGFPNAGKSTLLSKLTTATPEIKAYAFTTKKLNLGYIREPGISVQIIDTPGTLNRVDKMNYIEMQAYLALKYLADLVIYVFDPRLETPLDEQEKLLSKLKKTGKEILLYMSKTDIADRKIIEEIKDKYPDIKDIETIRKELIIKSKA